MIETAEALASTKDIVRVPGVDARFVGLSDLSVALGLPPGDNDREPAFDDAIKKISRAAKDAKVALCIMTTETKTIYAGIAVAFVGGLISMTHSPGPLADLVCSLLPCRQ